MLAKFCRLTANTKLSCDAAIEDQDRLIDRKGDAASNGSWIIQTALIIFRPPEPTNMARISTNIQGAQEIYKWAKDVVSSLEHTQLHLRHARFFLKGLEDNLRKYGLVDLSVEELDRELKDFLAQIDNSTKAVKINTDAWRSLQR
ncbi:MAG: hypothetical protein LQ350_008448, partial [Teloschistes chrysophthalmus]